MKNLLNQEKMDKINKDQLLISSDFYSCQGEGISTGIPSYFVRLATCNLTCGMSQLFTNNLRKEQTLEDGEIFIGDLEKEGKATWTCDSTSQWLYRGINQDFQYLIDRWKEQGIYEDIKNGTIRIIWTGGEPTIKKHQEAIINFYDYWDDIIDYSGESSYNWNTFDEIETNGTIYIKDRKSVV